MEERPIRVIVNLRNYVLRVTLIASEDESTDVVRVGMSIDACAYRVRFCYWLWRYEFQFVASIRKGGKDG